MKQIYSNISTMVRAIRVLFILSITIACLASCADERINEREKAYLDQVSNSLKKPGDTILISSIYEGDWSEVCAQGTYDRVSTMAARHLRIPTEQLVIRNTYDQIATDSVWGLVFYYPPNEIEYYRIPVSRYPYRGGDCTSHDDAAFLLTEVFLPHKGEISGLKIIALPNPR